MGCSVNMRRKEIISYKTSLGLTSVLYYIALYLCFMQLSEISVKY